MSSQVAHCVAVVVPSSFQYNVEAAADNHFMHAPLSGADEHCHHPPGASVPVSRKVIAEWAGLVRRLLSGGVRAHIYSPPLCDDAPDAVFPNNWQSTHTLGDGRRVMFVYPMKCVARRSERHSELCDELRARCTEFHDLSGRFEGRGLYCEGTGSMVFDRDHAVVYCCLSERTSPEVVQAVAEILGYRIVSFSSNDAGGSPIYHTNVMMSLGTHVAVVCLESIRNPQERNDLFQSLLASGRRIVEISLDQVSHFAGNILEVGRTLPDGSPTVWAMSTAAFNALSEEQRVALGAPIIHSDISTIEHLGGGGVRCCLAEIFV